MATNDSKVISRDSLKTGLLGRYETQKAGGAYNVQQDLKTNGSNALSVGASSFDQLYTVNKGFKIKQGIMQTEFKEAAAGGVSKGLSLYIKGLDTRRYSDNTPR